MPVREARLSVIPICVFHRYGTMAAMPEQSNGQPSHDHQGHEHHHDHQPQQSTSIPAPMMHSSMPLAKPQRDWAPLYTPISIVVAGLLVAIGLFFGLSHGGGVNTAAATGT